MDNIIKIRGARQHNLKNINLDIPKNKLVVFTGVSGSGKSSLAFDTIYAEGQRRYVESLSTYARQFLGIMEKPDVDTIEGLSPAISIDQKTTSRNPRSTVGTVTEIYDYFRLLFARIGHPHCPICGREIQSLSLDEINNAIYNLIGKIATEKKISRYLILSPMVNDKKGEYSGLFDNLKAKGFKQVRIDGYIKDLGEDFILIKTNKHTIEAVVDKFSVSYKNLKDKIYQDNLKKRLSESIEQSLKLSEGLVIVSEVMDASFEMPEIPKKMTDHLFSEKFACPIDNISLPEIEPRTFSFNSPHGACPTCMGIGKILKVDTERVFSEEISITEGGILPFSNIFEHDTWYSRLILQVCAENGIDPRTPIKNINETQRKILLEGTENREYRVEGTNRQGRQTFIYEVFAGIVGELEMRHAQTESDWVRAEIEKYMKEQICGTCKGTRLKKEALSITIDHKNISEICSFSIIGAMDWVVDIFSNGKLNQREKRIGDLILKEIRTRLGFLISVGLNYLTLDRASGSLSGGEAQRIRLASQIGSGLTGVLYVLDEPTIGLHQKDNDLLINTLKKLRDLGNTVIVVEHDSQTIKQSDHVIDFGPGAGKEGGEIVAEGTPKDITSNNKSLTGQYLSGKRKIDLKKSFVNLYDSEGNIKSDITLFGNPLFLENERNDKKKELTITGCSQYNLKNITVNFPLNKLVVITGVSGSGKSTLLVETLYPILEKELNSRFRGEVGLYKQIQGVENVDKVILIDQSPIGRTPRSNPATYTKVFDFIRDVYADTREARTMGYKKGRFSFNVRGGRCEACEGQGQTKIEMQFMSDIWITCEVCGGKRYNAQTLEVNYRGKNISEVLEMTVAEATEFFHSHSKIIKKLETLNDVGLSYMQLGQPATTLSGGEAQRIKLATELSKKDTGNTVYILDEPTTGLHFADVEKLLKVLKLLVIKGNSVFVIEHNIDVIRNADWIIDLGPEGGDEGGEVVAEGDVASIARSSKSYTGKYLSAK
jgi:excinuclease ABC subunit A